MTGHCISLRLHAAPGFIRPLFADDRAEEFIELKHLSLVEQRDRGERATVHPNAQAIIAIRETVLEWIRAHAELAERLGKL